MKYLEAIGKYFIMIWEVFKKPTKWRIMKTLILKEVDELVFGAMGIIIFISFFIGGVVTIQTALNQSAFAQKSYRVCGKTIRNTGICTDIHLYNNGRKGRILHYLQYWHYACYRTNRCP